MGIQGLWKLIECAATPTKMEDWSDCSIAVDASVWMVQFERSRQTFEDEGGLQLASTSHRILVGFLQRILKLLFYGVKPLIVFDGKMGSEKKAEHDRRRDQREKTERNRVIRYMQRTLAAQGFDTSKRTLSLLMSEQSSAAAADDNERYPASRSTVSDTRAPTNLRSEVRKRKRERSKLSAEESAKRTETVSRSSTLSFLQSSSEYLTLKRSGDAVKDSNLVRSSSTSLYLGPRNVLDSAANSAPSLSTTPTVFTLSQHSEHSSDVECIDPAPSKVWKTTKELSREIDVDSYVVSSQSQMGPPSLASSSFTENEESDSENSSVVCLSGNDLSSDWPIQTITDEAGAPNSFGGFSSEEFAAETEVGADLTGTQHVPLHLLELVDLLHALDVPYVISPHEADAQCAWLNKLGIVDAVFTEDSDVVVHGAPVVLRGFFSGEGTVYMYRQQDLVKVGFTRPVLVSLAALLQSDYSQGIPGVSGSSALQTLACVMGPTYFLQAGSQDTIVGRVSASLLERWFQLVELRDEADRQRLESQLEVLQVSLLQRAVILDLLGRKAWKRFELPREVLPNIRRLAMSILRKFTFTTQGNAEEIRAALNPGRTPQPQWSQVRLLASLRGGSFLSERIRLVESKMNERQNTNGNFVGRWRQLTLAHHTARPPRHLQHVNADAASRLSGSCQLLLMSGATEVVMV